MAAALVLMSADTMLFDLVDLHLRIFEEKVKQTVSLGCPPLFLDSFIPVVLRWYGVAFQPCVV